MSGSAVVLAPMSGPDFTSTMPSTCTQCGHDNPTPDEAHRRIKDLEAQVRLLNTKAAAAVDKLADYEDEVRSLRTAYSQLQQQHQQQLQTSPSKQQSSSQAQPSAPTPPADRLTPSPALTPTTTQISNPTSPPRNPTSRLASLSSFLPGRRRDTALLAQAPSTPSVALFPDQPLSETPPRMEATGNDQPIQTLHTLQATLETERTLRIRAESNLTQTQSELEELTATLFGQANEMVAQERRARAKLEERVKMLEDRDGEKKRRLERLEKALERIERVRVLVREEEVLRRKDKERENQTANGLTEAGRHDGQLRVVNDVAVQA